jgi:hypothetical protein
MGAIGAMKFGRILTVSAFEVTATIGMKLIIIAKAIKNGIIFLII